jgi:release factor glutamine methyltransferase
MNILIINFIKLPSLPLFMIYEPREDSYLLQKYVEEHAFGRVLDMGTGSGILAFTAANTAESVLAVDIDEEAVKHVNKSAKNMKMKNLKAVKSDLFSKVKTKFNTIIFNPPYLPNCNQAKEPTIDGGANGWEVIDKFMSKAGQYLRQDGIILLLFSSFTDKLMVDQIVKKNKFRHEELAALPMDFEELYIYKIFR